MFTLNFRFVLTQLTSLPFCQLTRASKKRLNAQLLGALAEAAQDAPVGGRATNG
jgi:hypothetical protein